MAIFNININDSGTVINPKDLKVYYGSTRMFPNDESSVTNLDSQEIKDKIISYDLDNEFRRHSIVLPFGINILDIININNLNEIITDQYEVINEEVIVNKYQYKVYGLENDAKYINNTIHMIGIDGEYNGIEI